MGQKRGGKISFEDQEFLEEVFRKHQPWMLRLAKRYVPELMDAEDILSNVCLKMFEKVDLLRQLTEEQQVAYLSRAVRNESINSIRKKKNLQSFLARMQSDHIPSMSEETEEGILLTELWENILQITMNCPEAEKNVVWLKYKLGLSTEEIAEKLEMTQSGVRTALSRAMAKLRSALSEGRSTNE